MKTTQKLLFESVKQFCKDTEIKNYKTVYKKTINE